LFSQIACIFRKRLVVLFSVLIRDARTTAHLLDHFEQIVSHYAVLAQDLAGVAVFLINDRQQQMLSRDKLVLHLVLLLLRGRKYLAQTRTEILLTALHAR